MNASAVALKPPAISKTTPRSQVINETNRQLRFTSHGEDILAMVENTTEAVIITCRLCENGLSLKKYSSITSRQT
jgi:predicted methyltransferase